MKKTILLISLIILLIYLLINCNLLINPGKNHNNNYSGSSSSTSSNSSESSSSSSSIPRNHIWTQYNEDNIKPQPRLRHAMSYAGNSKLILFGGLGSQASGKLESTWEYDASTHTWTQWNTEGISGTDKPFPRYNHAMTYAGGTKLILFGGFNVNSNKDLGDTWEYDVSNHTWTQWNKTGTKPEARNNQAMAYIGGTKLILFGGFDDNNTGGRFFDDTWEYDVSAHTWTQWNITGTKPSGRNSHEMVYTGGTKLILFGGYDFINEALGDTWEYDIPDHAWTQYNIDGTNGMDKPNNRYKYAMAYAGDTKLILFGGYNSAIPFLDDTWEYDVSAHTWTQWNIDGTIGIDKPDIRCDHAMDYAGGTKLILFGGYNSTINYFDDTWEYNLSE